MTEKEKLALAEKVCQIAEDASALMKHRPSEEEITQKGNISNYVTATDVAVQHYLEEKLTALIEGSEVLGEESDECVPEAEAVWIVDPIDGTSNFIRDLGASVISIALMQNNVLEIGVVYNPYRNEMFYAAKGCGAYLNGTKIQVSERDFSHSHFCSALCLYAKEYAEQCMKIIGRVYQESDDLRRLGAAALELSQLAAGRVELYFEMRIAPWDAAAGALLIEEAGGYWECLYDEGMQTGKLFPFIAANSKESFDKLRRIVTEYIPEIPYDGSFRNTALNAKDSVK